MAPRGLSHHSTGTVIWQQLNPKKIKSAAHDRYERYKMSRTFPDAAAAGMTKQDRFYDVQRGYVKAGKECASESDGSCIMRRPTMGPVAPTQIACASGTAARRQCARDRTVTGRGRQPLASSDGGSSPHEAAARSEFLVSSDGSSYAAPSVGLAPDTRIACVSDDAIACARRQCASDRTVAGRGRLVRRRLIKKTRQPPDQSF
jgi:hypothetical protein